METAAANASFAQSEQPENQESVKLLLAQIVHEARKIARKHFEPLTSNDDKVKMVRNLHDTVAQTLTCLRPLALKHPWPKGERILGLLKSIQYTTRQPERFADRLQNSKWVNASLLKDANELTIVAGITSAIEDTVMRRSPTRPRIVVVPARAAMKQLEEDPYLTVNEVARVLNVHPRTVSRWFFDYPGVINLGEGPYRRLRIPRSALIRYINERRVP